ncbi:hypothetical protein C1645_827072 [Glomus cerebriforme]|uniref:HTH myb-type domain-containing protein n=1 Tax=Glomus cerebriforme TaxID=658196 RepID=A0A397STP2_9GLOM|nr:hypothetical protein C1645_827072 [Glomus cerebriforme]
MPRTGIVRSRTRFNENTDNIIINCMASMGHRDDCFARIARIIPPYNARQIASRWRNKLDPQISPEPLTMQEKIFINNKIRGYEMVGEKILWREIIRDLETTFGKRHTDNRLRNYWYSPYSALINHAINQSNGTDQSNGAPAVSPINPVEPEFIPNFINCSFKMNPIF